MTKDKQIETTLKTLWAIKDEDQFYFMEYGKEMLEGLINDCETIRIYKFQLELIKEALRVTANIHNSRTKFETCHDRMVVAAEQYAENALNEELDKKVRYGIKP